MTWRRFLPAALLLLACAPSHAQRVYCNITSIESVRRGNAVQVTIRADGIMRVVADPGIFFDLEAAQKGQWDKLHRLIDTVPIWVTNARSQVGSFANVGVYPVSHVEASVPVGAQDGIGLALRVNLLTPGVVSLFKSGNENWETGGNEMPVPKISLEVSQDQRSIVILVTSDRRTQPPAVRRKAAPADPRELEVTGRAGRVSVNALNGDLRELLARVGTVSGTTVLVDPGLDRQASMRLDEAPLDDALDAIAQTYGLALERRDGTVRVADGDSAGMAAYDVEALETVRVRYGSAVAIRNSLPEFLLRYIHANPGENALSVFGPAGLVRRLREDIGRLDKPVAQIEVTATTVEYNRSDDLEALPELRGRGAFGDAVASPDSSGIRYTSVGALEADFGARLRALSSQGRVRIKSEPKAVVLSGRAASLFAGQQKYIKAITYNTFVNAYDTVLMPVEVGARLTVSATAGGGGSILLGVIPQVSNIVELDAATGAPTVSTRTAGALMRIQSGETLFIGGLDIVQDEPAHTRIPVLGDLPLIGRLFNRHGARRAETRLGVFVTARTLPGTT